MANAKKPAPAKSAPSKATSASGAKQKSAPASSTKPAPKAAAKPAPASTKANSPKPSATKPATKPASKSAPAAAAPAKAASAKAASAPAKATAKTAPSKPSTSKPAASKPSTSKPAGDKPAGDKPAAAKPVVAKPAATKSVAAVEAPAPAPAPAPSTSPANTSSASTAAKGKAKPPKPEPSPIAQIPPPKGSKDGISFTKDFDLKFLQSIRTLLLSEREQLSGQASALEAEANQLIEESEMGDVEFGEEGGEGDTLVVERERDLAMAAVNRQHIGEIDDALARLEIGTYGYSLVSGLPIPRERLEAIPWATARVEEKVGGLGRR
jgi:RNA polymerase-binding transcription factor DksA